MGSNRNYALDLLKVLASTIIVFHHYQQVFCVTFSNGINYFDPTNEGFYFGYVVELFFIISGMLVFPYINRIQNGLSFKNFYCKKAIRILPMVAITAVAYEVLLYIYERFCGLTWPGGRLSFWGTIIDALGIQADGAFINPSINNPTWYISVLFMCYAIFYFLTYISQSLKIKNIYMYIGVIVIGVTIVSYGISSPFFNWESGRGYYSFFTGVLLAYIIDYLSDKNYNKVKAIFVELAIITIVLWIMIFHWNTSISWSDCNFVLNFIFYPAVILLFSTVNPLLCKCKLIGTLGNVSFDVYVWHSPLFILIAILKNYGVINVDNTSRIWMYAIVAFIWVVSSISYFLIRKNIQKLLSYKYL